MSAVSRQLFKWHRWLAWLVGLQLLVWVSSGVLFAWLPFQPWVKAGDQFQRPVLGLSTLPAGLDDLDPAAVRALTMVATPSGPAWKLSLAGQPGSHYRGLDGAAWKPPLASDVERFARSMIRAEAAVVAVERLEGVPRRLLIVDETGGRGQVWRVSFDDTLGTRVYLDATGGDLVAVRNEAWVWYDFFWRLHIMDYRGGEDFNNGLLRAASVAAWGLGAAGMALAWLALRRAWRRPRR